MIDDVDLIRPSKVNVLLTPRDLALLESLYDNVVMTYSQVARAHFEGAQKPTVLNRLSKLKEAGLISRERIPRTKIGLDAQAIGVVFQITRLGINELKSRHPLKEFRSYPIRIHPFSLEHDLILADVMVALKTKWPGVTVTNGKHFLSTSQNQKGLEPDLIVTMPDGKGAIAVELELNDKSEKRYREIVLRYRMSEFEKVIYLVGRPGIFRLIARVITNRNVDANVPPDTGRFYFADAFEFLNNPDKVPITNGVVALSEKGGNP